MRIKLSAWAPAAEELWRLARCVACAHLLKALHVRNAVHGGGHEEWQAEQAAEADEQREHEQVQMVPVPFDKFVFAPVDDHWRDLLVHEELHADISER